MKNNSPRHTMGKGLQQRASVNSGAYTMASIYARGQIARGYARRLGAARDAIAFTVALSVTLSSVGQWAYGMRLSTHQPELARRVFQQILCGLAEVELAIAPEVIGRSENDHDSIMFFAFFQKALTKMARLYNFRLDVNIQFLCNGNSLIKRNVGMLCLLNHRIVNGQRAWHLNSINGEDSNLLHAGQSTCGADDLAI